LNIVPGLLEIDDGEGQSTPLSASVTLDAGVFGPTGDRLTGASAHADLTGHGGTFQTETFNLDSAGLGATLTKQDDGGNNVVGATAVWGARQLPLDLSRIVDGTHIEIDVDLVGNVFAPSGETIATAFFRDPAHANDPDPLAGASTATFETASPGNPVPEPATLALLAPALAAMGLVRRRGAAGIDAPCGHRPNVTAADEGGGRGEAGGAARRINGNPEPLGRGRSQIVLCPRDRDNSNFIVPPDCRHGR
jgi:hypothetical protein